VAPVGSIGGLSIGEGRPEAEMTRDGSIRSRRVSNLSTRTACECQGNRTPGWMVNLTTAIRDASSMLTTSRARPLAFSRTLYGDVVGELVPLTHEILLLSVSVGSWPDRSTRGILGRLVTPLSASIARLSHASQAVHPQALRRSLARGAGRRADRSRCPASPPGAAHAAGRVRRQRGNPG
jgi:hypothetical protein